MEVIPEGGNDKYAFSLQAGPSHVSPVLGERAWVSVDPAVVSALYSLVSNPEAYQSCTRYQHFQDGIELTEAAEDIAGLFERNSVGSIIRGAVFSSSLAVDTHFSSAVSTTSPLFKLPVDAIQRGRDHGTALETLQLLFRHCLHFSTASRCSNLARAAPDGQLLVTTEIPTAKENREIVPASSLAMFWLWPLLSRETRHFFVDDVMHAKKNLFLKKYCFRAVLRPRRRSDLQRCPRGLRTFPCNVVFRRDRGHQRRGPSRRSLRWRHRPPRRLDRRPCGREQHVLFFDTGGLAAGEG